MNRSHGLFGAARLAPLPRAAAFREAERGGEGQDSASKKDFPPTGAGLSQATFACLCTPACCLEPLTYRQSSMYTSAMDDPDLAFAKALADDTRQAIMRLVCCEWLSVNDVVDRLGARVNQPTVSHHLKVLEQAGLVRVRAEGRFRFYTLNQEKVTVCCGSLMKTFAPDFARPADQLGGAS